MTNDLISRKALLVMFENRKWFFTSDIINSINYIPAIQQCDEGEPVAHISAIYKFTNMPPNISWYQIDNTQFPVGTNLYVAPPDQTARIKELEKKCNAYKTLTESLQGQLEHYRRTDDAGRVAIATLQSEKDMNSQLTGEISELTAKVEKMREVLQTLYDENESYITLNNLGAMDNLCMVMARKALEECK